MWLCECVCGCDKELGTSMNDIYNFCDDDNDDVVDGSDGSNDNDDENDTGNAW